MRPAQKLQRGLSGRSDYRIIPAIAADGTRYPVDKMEAHRQGLLHDAVSVFVFDGADMLLQQRAAGKYHCALMWANACCTHPDWGERHEASARRRVREELGADLPLTACGETTYHADVGGGLIEHERVRLYRARVDRRDLVLNPDPAEVAQVRWISRPALIAEIAAAPDRFAPWLRIYLERWAALGLDR
ncbi:NUDIX domain-containing protein [Alkalicaulis satelles]|uniref:isopentenyl-diphosphate Delta-isomerase n=1 Tax=Alkalicaulis satelles TaxID=2609175 RepID=A0A5M6ZJX4_9PROT|nr:NUDIX domain-containing protein [Alkalicaulis satelles]KAA5804034.1 NUDIX domain-containing protein [Alkalicaulis satelles]